MQSVSAKLPKCIVVSGMTGCGKSDVTRRLAARHNGVIVCGDSVQLNRGLDILTNKNKDVLLTSKYLIKDHLDANRYTIDARREILQIIQDGKTPIIDGGSWFYIKHLFTGVAEAYARCDVLAEVKEISKKIIEKDTTDFFISKSRLEKLASEVGYTDIEIQENDKYRIEQKLTHVLYLMKTKENHEEFIQRLVKSPEHQLFTSIPRINFFLCQSKLGLNPIIDTRCEKMVQHPDFFQQIYDFQTELQQLIGSGEITKQQAKINPLYRCIGFAESVQYMKNKIRFEAYMEKFKVRTRHYSSYQFKTGRSCSVTRGGDYILLEAGGKPEDLDSWIDMIISTPEIQLQENFIKIQEMICQMNEEKNKQLNSYRSVVTLKRRVIPPSYLNPTILELF